MRNAVLTVMLAAGLLPACVPLGWSFGPGFSMRDRHDLFAEPPTVVRRGQQYVLTWQQGDYPFFFEPRYRAIDGRLVFALVATASSGSLARRSREMAIEGAENLAALRRGGAYWWEPEPEPRGTLVALRVVDSAW
jgi:hypothetical protein